jgi:hypothetical protein
VDHFREQRDFGAAIGIAAERLELHPQFIEKDYWVTEALRVLATDYANHFTFKGGTSLSKGYGLIERFSEDIDILVVADAGLGNAGREAKLAEISHRVGDRLGLDVREAREPGRGRNASRADLIVFEPQVDQPVQTGLDTAGVLLETGFAGAEEPAEVVEVRALIFEPLEIELDEFEDSGSFQVRALEPVRTCLEKVCGMHHIATSMLADPEMDVPRIGRHYWDIDRLLEDERVRARLADPNTFEDLVRDVERVSERHFGGCTPRPEGGFAQSPAFGPPEEIRPRLQARYEEAALLMPHSEERQLRSFGSVLQRISRSADLL